MRSRVFICCGLVLSLAWVSTPRAQQATDQHPPTQSGSAGPTSPDFGQSKNDSPFAADQAARQAKLLESDRRKHILDDTARLVALTNELKAEVDKSTKDEMSLTVIRKAAEIEKLSHDLKERMKGN